MGPRPSRADRISSSSDPARSVRAAFLRPLGLDHEVPEAHGEVLDVLFLDGLVAPVAPEDLPHSAGRPDTRRCPEARPGARLGTARGRPVGRSVARDRQPASNRVNRGRSKEGASVNTRVRTTLLAAVLGWAVLWDPTVAAAQLEDSGIGFVMRSGNFGQPCTTNPGDIRDRLRQHHREPGRRRREGREHGRVHPLRQGPRHSASGPTRRPRVMRFTLGPHETLGIRAQTSACGWIAVVRPH